MLTQGKNDHYAGTDELPHGSLAKEITTLHRYGLPATSALIAASTAARAYLGLPAWEVGALADFVSFAADPRRDIAVLAWPVAVILGGQAMRMPTE